VNSLQILNESADHSGAFRDRPNLKKSAETDDALFEDVTVK
jgi:hypothetical protein